jgi:hypothetical protein
MVVLPGVLLAHGAVVLGAPTTLCGFTVFGVATLCPWTVGPFLVDVAGFESGGAIISGAFGIESGAGAVAAGGITCAIDAALIPSAIAIMTDLTNI